MTIPEEAVEAAKAAVRAHAHVELEAEHLIEGVVRAALEAAAPHLMAQAWNDGRQAWDNYDDDNPYMSAK